MPSPKYPDGRSVMQCMMEEKYGQRGTMSKSDDNWITVHGGPYKSDVLKEIIEQPQTRVSDWAVEACAAYADYLAN